MADVMTLQQELRAEAAENEDDEFTPLSVALMRRAADRIDQQKAQLEWARTALGISGSSHPHAIDKAIEDLKLRAGTIENAPAVVLARRIACRVLDIDPDAPSEDIEHLFHPDNMRGVMAVQEARTYNHVTVRCLGCEEKAAIIDGGSAANREQALRIDELGRMNAELKQQIEVEHTRLNGSRRDHEILAREQQRLIQNGNAECGELKQQLEEARRERDEALSPACIACPRVGCKPATVQLCDEHSVRVHQCPECESFEVDDLDPVTESVEGVTWEKDPRRCRKCGFEWTDSDSDYNELEVRYRYIAKQNAELRRRLAAVETACEKAERLSPLDERWPESSKEP
jgi:hypothetical protein